MVSRAFTKSAPVGAAENRPSLRRRGLKRVAVVGVATVGAVALAMATPAAAYAVPIHTVTLPTPEVFLHTNLKNCDQIAPTGDVLLLGSGGQPQDATNANGTGGLHDGGALLDITIHAPNSVTAIIVKAGDDSNVFFFDPPEPGEAFFEDLYGPANPGSPHPQISHWLVCGIVEGGEIPEVSATLTSEVHLDGTHAVIDISNPATAPADVHDSVILTVSGLAEWSGTVTVRFFEGLECGPSVDAAIDSVNIPVTQLTGMPLEDVLPKLGWPPAITATRRCSTPRPMDSATSRAPVSRSRLSTRGPRRPQAHRRCRKPATRLEMSDSAPSRSPALSS